MEVGLCFVGGGYWCGVVIVGLSVSLYFRAHPMVRAHSFGEPPSDTMCLLIRLRKPTPPRNCQLDISISNSKQSVDDFVGELTF